MKNEIPWDTGLRMLKIPRHRDNRTRPIKICLEVETPSTSKTNRKVELRDSVAAGFPECGGGRWGQILIGITEESVKNPKDNVVSSIAYCIILLSQTQQTVGPTFAYRMS